MGEPFPWAAVTYEVDGVRAPGKIQLCRTETTGAKLTDVELRFEGSPIPTVVGAGDGELAAMLNALHAGNDALGAFRSSGGRIFRGASMSGFDVLDEPLEELFRFSLEAFGLEKRRIDAEIISGPTPDASGDVVFKVRVRDRIIETHAWPCGMETVRDDDLDAGQDAAHTVCQFLREHADEVLSWYREAARLRRAAGNPGPFDLTTVPRITVVGNPQQFRGFVEFKIGGVPMDLRVDVFEEGGIMDDCDDWSALNQADRNAAFAATLQYVFSHREEVTALGLDVDLLAEFYCNGPSYPENAGNE